jgi:hypothetical protein
MILQDLKSNINKIDFDLKSLFENVYVSEKSEGSRFYFEIKANGKFKMDESSSQRRELVIRIDKSDLLSNRIRWSYSANPMDEKSEWVERVSGIDTISLDSYEVVSKGRMDSAYLESLECIVESINESSEVVEKTLVENVTGILGKYGYVTSLFEVSSDISPVFENNIFMTKDSDRTFIFPIKSEIKLSDKFMIESEINSLPNVSWTLFRENYIEVSCSY